MKEFKIIQKRKIFFVISGILILAAVFALFSWGLNLGIDFTGGTLMELSFKQNRPDARAVREYVVSQDIQGITQLRVQPTGQSELIIRTRDLSEDEHQALLGALRDKYGDEQVVENRFESIGPAIGRELKDKAVTAMIVVLVMIVLYIAYAFKGVSKQLASWKYGLSAIFALIHDILIITGIFAVLGYYLDFEVGILFVTALLTVLGYSVNDTIVVFDRVRENLIHNPKESFEATLNHSVNQTITRSINTSLTTLLVLSALFFFGGSTISEFVLVLILGAVFGTYSSIFVASPMLVVWHKLGQKKI